MKLHANHLVKYMAASCMTAGFFALAVSFPSEAALNAGFSASLGDSLSSQTSVYHADFQLLESAANAQNNPVCGYTNLGVANVENHLNIREGAGEDQELVGKLPKVA